MTLPVATPTNAGLMATGDKSKLDGIAAGAQVNTVTSVAGKTGAVTLAVGDIANAVGTTDNRLTNAREWTATTIAKTEAEAGTATTRRAFTAQRVRQAILGWWNGSADKTKLDGIQAGAQVNVATNLAIGGSGNSRTITSSTGTNVSVPVATTTNAGLMATGDKSKLDGIAAGAQVNTVTSVAGKTGAVTLAVGDVSNAVATTDTRMTNAREWTATTIAQTEAEAGTATTRRAFTAQRVRQAILGWWNGSADKTKLDSIQAGAQVNAATNLGQGGSGNSRTITSSTGSNVTVSTATTSNAGFMSTSDKSKLDGIAAGAQVNIGTNLGSSGTGATRIITSSTGSNTSITYSAADIGALSIGEFGLGATGAGSGDVWPTNTLDDANVPSGMYYANNPSGGPSGVNTNGLLIHRQFGSAGGQIFIPRTGDGVGGFFYRSRTSSTWSAWRGGALLTPGDFGIGTTEAPSIGDFLDNLSGGVYAIPSGTSNGPGHSSGSTVYVASWDSNNWSRLLVDGGGSSVNTPPRLFLRAKNFGTVKPWQEVYHTGNLTPVETSRMITAGDGLSGGGDLGANRTLNVDSSVVRTSGNQTISGTKTFSGILRAQGTNLDSGGVTRTGRFDLRPAVAEGSTRQAVITTDPLTSTRTYTFPNASGHVVLESRMVTAGDGLSGGGTLASNRTISVDNTVVRTGRSITAGTGLAGGGSLAANRTITIDEASPAEAQAGTRSDRVITPRRVRDALNADGAAPLYACRAWVNFDASGIIRLSGNVSSVSRFATGGYHVNFETSIGTSSYAVSLAADLGTSGGSNTNYISNSGRLSTAVTIRTVRSGSFANCDTVHVAVFR